MPEGELLLQKAVHPASDESTLSQHVVDCRTPAKGENFIPVAASVTLPDQPIAGVIRPPQVLTPSAKAFDAYNMIVAWDTEYVCRGDHNEILTYQYTALYRDDSREWQYAEGILEPFGPEFSDRLKLKHIFEAILKAFAIGRRRANSITALLIAHFGVAEWAALRDRKAVAERLTAVRGVPVSFKFIPVSVDLGAKNYAKLRVKMMDTYLLAPTKMQSLKAISSVTAHKKLDLSEKEVGDMARLRVANPQKYDAYAINDARVTLEYFLSTVREYESLFNVDRFPVTLGGGAVEAFLKWLENDSELTYETVFGYEHAEVKNEKGWNTTAKKEVSSRAYTRVFASHAYHGGMNIAFHIGDYHDPEKIILDIDFSGAYPAALATLPVVDWHSRRPLYNHRGKLLSYLDACREGAANGMVPIAMVECHFTFPKHTQYPCLPVPTRDGLKYPLEGVTTCTGIEMILAHQMGAQINVIQVESFPSRPRLAFADFLKVITQKRAQEAKHSLRNLLLKETANSFYGKLAQGIKDRNVFNFSDQSEKLKPSLVTCPHYAAMCTGIVRAALSAVVYEIGQREGYEVLSATTDGCMIAVPKRFELETDEAGRVLVPGVAGIIPELYAAFKQHHPIMALEQGRLNMGLEPDTWLEIKYAGDSALTLKTRGNIIEYKGVEQHIAKAGHQVNTADELKAIHRSDEIAVLEVASLNSIKDIYQGHAQDLLTCATTRKANTDYDYKRIPLFDDQGRATGQTRPPITVQESNQWRRAADTERKRGIRATPEIVAQRIAGHPVQKDTPTMVRRAVHKAIAHNACGCRPPVYSDRELAACLGIKYNTFRTYKSREFHHQSLLDTEETRDLIQQEAAKIDPDMVERLFIALLSMP